MPREIVIPRQMVVVGFIVLTATCLVSVFGLAWTAMGIHAAPPDPTALAVVQRSPTATPGALAWPTRRGAGTAATATRSVLWTAVVTPTEVPGVTPGSAGAAATPTLASSGAAPTAKPAAAVPASAAKASGALRVGVRANLNIAPADRERTLRLAHELGVQWIGDQVAWRDYQGEPGEIRWGFLDDAVQAASSQGFKLLLSVTKAPGWALTNDGPDPVAYGEFVAALVGRYKGQVQAIEVYNEANLASEWGTAVNPAAYARLLQTAYRRIKAVDPAVVVVSSGLTPTGVNDPWVALDDVAFLQQVQAAGGLKFCDAVGAHASGFNNPPEAQPGSRCAENPRFGCHDSFYILRYRALQAVAGGKPLWVTECGYAATNDPQPGYEYARDNREDALGDYVAATIKLLRADRVGACFWWNLNYAPLAPGSEQAAFSLIDQNWSPRTHYHRLKGEIGA
ncbi:MAG: hypothetical protein KKA73_31265 [Chloroflexi bacterium]|nr:hypothetical protein [Chloroflexota bacterium]MBU1752182.1 hypothetical protein [Chloroflexota bacterium]